MMRRYNREWLFYLRNGKGYIRKEINLIAVQHKKSVSNIITLALERFIEREKEGKSFIEIETDKTKLKRELKNELKTKMEAIIKKI